MEITESTIYWITRCDVFLFYCILLSILSSVMIVVGSIGYLVNIMEMKPLSHKSAEQIDKRDEARWYLKIFKRVLMIGLSIALFAVPCSIFTPSTKDMAAIKIIPAIANSQEIKDTTGKLHVLAGEWLEELRPKKKLGGEGDAQ